MPSGDHAGNQPSANSSILGTHTENDTVPNNPPGSLAVTVTVAVPPLLPVTVTVLPLVPTTATPLPDDFADKDTRSPFSSVKHTRNPTDFPTGIV